MLQYIRNVMKAKRDEGAAGVEYGLLVAAIAALIVIVVFALGKMVKAAFDDTCKGIEANASANVNAAANCT